MDFLKAAPRGGFLVLVSGRHRIATTAALQSLHETARPFKPLERDSHGADALPEGSEAEVGPACNISAGP